jgi:hypothetical protein
VAILKQDLNGSHGGQYSLELDGAPAGRVASASGGLAMADVVEEKPDPKSVIHKHLAGVKYSDIELSCDAGTIVASAALQAWIQAFFASTFSSKNGAVIETGTDGKQRSRTSFNNSFIHEVGLPALDASDPAQGAVSVKLIPESTRLERPGSAPAKGPVPGSSVKQGSLDWAVNNFRVKIDGLDCTHVSHVDPIVATAVIVADAVGQFRNYTLQPAHLECSDLVLTLADDAAQSFYDWHNDFVINGNNTASKEKTGTIEILDRTLKTTLFTLSLSGLGIFKLAPYEADGSTSGIQRVLASLYCETIAFALGPPATPVAPTGGSQPTTDVTIPIIQGGPVLSGQYPDQFTRLRRVN